MQINIEKRNVFLILAVSVFLAGILIVVAYNSNPANPSIMGHTSNEISFTEDFTTCNTIIDTTSSSTVPWTAIEVPSSCTNKPCKLVVLIKHATKGIVDIRFGDYYQAGVEDDATKERWEYFGNIATDTTRRTGNNGDSTDSVISSSSTYDYNLNDDYSGTDTTKERWAYRDYSANYGIIVKTCNY